MVVAQIALINLVFSIDSIVTAIGMANEIWGDGGGGDPVDDGADGRLRAIASFVEAHPTVKMLALGFLIMIGMALVADGFGAHVPKGYIYTAMVFSVFIEMINMRHRRKAKPVHLRNPYGAETEAAGDERRALEQAGHSGGPLNALLQHSNICCIATQPCARLGSPSARNDHFQACERARVSGSL